MTAQSFTLVVLLAALTGSSPVRSAPAVQSSFDTGDDGWIQVNIASDYRYLTDISPGDCSTAPANDLGPGVLTFCDPDAGGWMYQAPEKFLGDQSGRLDGRLEFQLRYLAVEPLTDYPENADANVVIASGDNAIVLFHPVDPTPNEWHTNSVALGETAPWLWVDDSTPMEFLPKATRAQIQEVLRSVTALRILGEFITGDDRGFLDNVSLSGPPDSAVPTLVIRLVPSGQVEVSWPASAADCSLEATQTPSSDESWKTVDTGSQTTLVFDVSVSARFFRLRRP